MNQELLRSVLHYNPDTGIWTWIAAPSKHSRKNIVGSVFGSQNKKDGYMRGRVFDKCYLLHRLAFMYMLGRWPVGDPDHENRIKHDNRWDNLRELTHQMNCYNVGITRRNTSGTRGVSFNKRSNRYVAYIGKRHLGTCRTYEEACQLRQGVE